MSGIARQIIGSFEDIGKDIVTEAIKLPTDIAQKAMEGLGASTSSTAQVSSPQLPSEVIGVGGGKSSGGAKAPQEKTALDAFAEASASSKKAVARAALEYLASTGAQAPKKKSVWDIIQEEEAQKKRQKDAQQQADRFAELPKMTSKRKRGDLYGAKSKATSAERKSVRQD